MPQICYGEKVVRRRAVTSLIDSLLPAALRNDTGIERKRARIALLTVLFLLLWGPVVAALYWWGGSSQGAGAVLITTLVVSSFPFVLRATGSLHKAGYVILVPLYGEAGLDKLAGSDPDLVLLDLMMPKMDGFEFLRHFRDDEARRDVPVVVVTAKELTAEDEEQLRTGVSEILAKGGRAQGRGASGPPRPPPASPCVCRGRERAYLPPRHGVPMTNKDGVRMPRPG